MVMFADCESNTTDWAIYIRLALQVLGTGNAALETADALAPYVNYVYEAAPQRVALTAVCSDTWSTLGSLQ